jgi:Restriction endonuclease
MYMTPVCYEQAVADSLKNLGWQTRLKKANEYRYAEVIAELHGKRVLIKCCSFMAPCIPTVAGIREAKSFEGADYAAIVSNAEFMPSGHQLARSVGVVLLRHDNLSQLERRTVGIGAQQGIVIADAA